MKQIKGHLEYEVDVLAWPDYADLHLWTNIWWMLGREFYTVEYGDEYCSVSCPPGAHSLAKY